MKMKSKNIRYFNTGWTRIYPFTKVIETPATLTNEQRDNEAHFLMQFGDQLDYQVLIVCKCIDYKTSTVYRFGFEEIIDDSLLRQTEGTSIGTCDLFVDKIKFYEPNSSIFPIEKGYEKDSIVNNGYLPNAIIFEFTNGKSLCLFGSEGDDQHEPSIVINFIDEDEKEIHEIENMNSWKLEYEI